MPVAHLGAKLGALLLFLAVSVAGFLFLFNQAGGRIALDDQYEVTVALPTAIQLVPGSDVRTAGVQVGRVKAVDPQSDGTARARLALDDDDVAPLRRDVRVRVRLKTLIGENYLDIEPGNRAGAIVPSGSSLPLANADDSVQIDELLSTFDADTRRHVKRSLAVGGRSLGRRGAELNQALGAAQPMVSSTAAVARVLAAQRRQLAGVASNTAVLMETFEQRGAQLRRLIRAGRATADAISSRDRALAASVRRLPGALRRTDAAATALAGLSGTATPVVGDLARASVALRPTLVRLPATARSTRQLFEHVPALADSAQPLLRRLRRLAVAAPPLLRDLPPPLRHVNPALAYLGRYRDDLGAYMGTVGTLNDVPDAIGSHVRVYPGAGRTTLNPTTAGEKRTTDWLLRTLGIDKVYRPDANPYPRPGTASSPRPFDGHVPRIEPDP